MKIRRTSGSFIVDELLQVLYIEARDERASVPSVAEFWQTVLEFYFDTPHRGFFIQVRPPGVPRVSTALCTIQDWAVRQVVYAKCYKPGPVSSQERASAEKQLTNFCRGELANHPGWEFVIAMVCFGTKANVWKVDSDGICGILSGYIDADCVDTKGIRDVLDEVEFPWYEEDENGDYDKVNQEAGFGKLFQWLRDAFAFLRNTVGWTGE